MTSIIRRMGATEKDAVRADVTLGVPKPTYPFAIRLTGIACFAVIGWSYSPYLLELISVWFQEPDYAHGFFIVPLALFFLYARRDQFPGLAQHAHWMGLFLIAGAFGLRQFGVKYFLSSLEGWSLVLLIAGTIWLLAGYSVFRWSLPAIAFLLFMIPIPYRAELLLSSPLQSVATRLSEWTLQALGEPALAEGNTIFLSEHQFEIARACSGLRIFVTSIAMGCGWAIISHRSWLETFIIIAASIPIAIIANALRIVMTCLLFEHSGFSTQASHDVPGWIMIPFSILMFGFLVLYLRMVFREVSEMEPLK